MNITGALKAILICCVFLVSWMAPTSASSSSGLNDRGAHLEYLQAERSVTAAEPVLGSQPWASILCRFSDVTDTPQPTSYFEELLSDQYPGLNHYWKEVSFGRMNLDGSKVFGWYNLPETREYYGIPGDSGPTIDWNKIIQDCMEVADPYVNFPTYEGVAIMLNHWAAASASIGGQSYTFDGQTRRYFTTVMPAPPPASCNCQNGAGWTEMGVVAHEMGHGLGLFHSSGPYGEVYDSDWDVLSNPMNGLATTGSCRITTVNHGCAPVHTLAHNKLDLGWIGASQVTASVPGTTQTFLLYPSEELVAGKMIGKVPLVGGDDPEGTFLSIEARKRVGYDQALPGEGVIIHRVEPTPGAQTGTTAYLMDADNNGDVNDQGAIWLPGEIYIHPSGAEVRILSQIGDAYEIALFDPLRNDIDPLGISGDGFSYTQGIVSATSAASDPSVPCSPQPLSHTVWFSFHGRSSAALRISVKTDGFIPTISLHRAGTMESCALGDATGKATLSFTPELFADYTVMVGSADGKAGIMTVSAETGPWETPRSLSLRLSKHLSASGALMSTESGVCIASTKVKIQRRTATGWGDVSAATTSATGAFNARLPDKPGSFRAKVASKTSGNYVCGAATSSIVKHRHR